jgi:hypothetical protein
MRDSEKYTIAKWFVHSDRIDLSPHRITHVGEHYTVSSLHCIFQGVDGEETFGDVTDIFVNGEYTSEGTYDDHDRVVAQLQEMVSAK